MFKRRISLLGTIFVLGLMIVLNTALPEEKLVRAQTASLEDAGALTTSAGFTYHSLDSNYRFCTAIATADINSDGWIDVLAASEDGTGSIQWWKNAGYGALFAQAVLSSGQGGATALFGRDLDDDGDTDIALVSTHNGKLATLENMGSTWTRNTHWPTSYTASALAPIDVEINGRSHLLVGSSGSNSGAYLVPFWSDIYMAQRLSSVSWPSAVYPDDIDRDGDIDYVVADFYRDGIIWYENGAGGLVVPHTLARLDAGATAFTRVVWLGVADLDRDGDPDIVAASDMHGLVWWANNGNGAAWTEHVITKREFYEGASLVLADLNADGHLDIVAGTRRQLVWLENLGRPAGANNWIRHVIDTSPYANSYGYAVAVGDVDRDGRLDVVGCDVEAGPGSTTGRRLGWWENKRLSVPASEVSFWAADIDSTLTGAWGVDLADFNGDGQLDVAASGYGESGVTGNTRLYNGTPGFPWTWAKFFEASFDKGRGLMAHRVGNGRPTYVVSGEAYTGEAREFWSTNWDWTASAQAARVTGLGTTYQAAVGDLNNDGMADVVGTSASKNDIVWWNGKTGTQTVIDENCAGARAVCLGDVDDDGLMDVGAACTNENNIIFLRQTGNPAMPWDRFASPVAFAGATDIACGDLDGDGRADLVAAQPGSPGQIGAMGYAATGGGGSTFTWNWVTQVFTGVEHLALGDIDRDGDLDVAATSASRQEVAWFENSSSSFTLRVVDESLGSVREIAIGDINGDGAPDLVVASESRNLVRWYEQRVATELSIDKSLDTTQCTGVISTGQSIPYIVEVTNNGVAGDVWVVDRWEPANEVVDAGSDEDCVSDLPRGVMTCTLSLRSGQIKPMSVVLTPSLLFDGVITNTAQVLPVAPFWNQTPYYDTDSAAPVVVQKNLAIWDGKISLGHLPSTTLFPGQDFTYTVGMMNLGPKSDVTAVLTNLWSPTSAIASFTILDTPGVARLTAADYTCITDDVADGVVCNFTDLEVGVPITLTIGVVTSETFTEVLEANIYFTGNAGDEGNPANNYTLPVRVGSRPWEKVYLPLILRS